MEPILSLKILQNELHGVCAKWRTLGVQLDIDSGTLKRIEQDGRGDVAYCLLELLIEWLKDNPSWKDIVNALRSDAMGEHSRADGIDRKYCSYGQRQSQSAPTKSPSWKWNADTISQFPSTSFPQDAQLPGNRRMSISSPPSRNWNTKQQVFPDLVGTSQEGDYSRLHQSASVPARLREYAERPGNRKISMPTCLPESGNDVIGMQSLQTNISNEQA